MCGLCIDTSKAVHKRRYLQNGMETVYFRDEYVTLNQFLKLSGAVNTGGEGKELIISGQVYVNGEIETRRGKKIRKGDKVRIEGSDTEYIAENE